MFQVEQFKFIIDKTAPVITPMISGKDIVIKDGSYINEIFTPYFKLDEADDTIVSVMMNGKDVTGQYHQLQRKENILLT